MSTRTPPQRLQIFVNGELWVDATLSRSVIDRLIKLYTKELKGESLKFKVGE